MYCEIDWLNKQFYRLNLLLDCLIGFFGKTTIVWHCEIHIMVFPWLRSMTRYYFDNYFSNIHIK